MLIDDLISIKNSLETTYKDFGKMKPYMLLKFCKNIILKEKNNFSQTELLSIINQIFGTNISYIIFNKFFHSFIKTEKSSKKKETIKTKEEEIKTKEEEIKTKEEEIETKEEEIEDIKKDTPKNEVPLKKTEKIVSEKKQNVNNSGGKGNKFANLPDVETTNVGLIESGNKGRIK